MLPTIIVGDSMVCLFCEEGFTLENIKVDSYGEYIKCPHCKKEADIHSYHRHGRRYDKSAKHKTKEA